MVSIKRIFCLLFLLCASYTTFFASLPITTKVLFFRSKSLRMPYHTNSRMQKRNFDWQQWGKKIFCPAELPKLTAKGIEGLTEKEVQFFSEKSDKTIHNIDFSQETTPLAELGKTALLESNIKIAQRMADLAESKSTNKSE